MKNKVYTEEDYKSGDGMLTTVWGPGLWHFLHTMSFNYPNELYKRKSLNISIIPQSYHSD
jgi:hypothetical protein